MTFQMHCDFWREGVVAFQIVVYKRGLCGECVSVGSFVRNLILVICVR